MSSRDTKQFGERKARIEQALMSEGKHLKKYKGLATAKQLGELTQLNEQAIRRIIGDLKREGKVDVVKDKSEIVLLKYTDGEGKK